MHMCTRTYIHECSQLNYSQYTKIRNNPNVYHQENGQVIVVYLYNGILCSSVEMTCIHYIKNKYARRTTALSVTQTNLKTSCWVKEARHKRKGSELINIKFKNWKNLTILNSWAYIRR